MDEYRHYHLKTRVLLCAICLIGEIFTIFSATFIDDMQARGQLLFNGLFAIGMIFLYFDVVSIIILDWKGAVSLRGLAKPYVMRDGEHVIRRGKYVSTVGMYIFLYIVMPYIMLAIYFVRVLGIFPTNPNENTVAFFSLPGRVEEQRQHIEERKQLIKERRSQHKARRSAIYQQSALVQQPVWQVPPLPVQHNSLDDLEKLASLRDRGIITQTEFNQKKRQILGL